MSWVTAIMRAAYTSGRVGRDVTIGTAPRRRRLKTDGVTPDDVPTRAEVASIWNAAPSRFRAAVALGASGLRVGEVLGITADRIDLDERLVTIDRQLQRVGGVMQFTTPNAEKPRSIRVPSAVALELRRHLREFESDGLLSRASGAATVSTESGGVRL